MTKALKGKILLILYTLSCILYVYFKLNDIEIINIVFKFVVIVLILLFYYNFKIKTNFYSLIILLFEMIGDCTLVYYDIDSFILGLPFFFVVNVFLILMLVERVDIIRFRKILSFFILSLFIIMPVAFFIFKGLGLIMSLVITFTILVTMLMTLSFYYYSINKDKKSALWQLLTVITLVLLYIFGGFTRLVKPEFLFRFLESIFYLIHLYFFIVFILSDEKERVE